MRRKLLIVTDEMEIGGTQRQIVELVRNLDRGTYAISVVYFRPLPDERADYVRALRLAGAKVVLIRKRWKFDLLFLVRLCRFMRRGEFDLIHAFSFGGELWSWLANMLAGRARFIGSARSVYEWYSPLQWRVKRWITLNSAALVANSRAGAEHAALQMGIRQSAIDIVHNGIRIDNEAAARRDANDAASSRDENGAERAAANKTASVLFVGRLVGHKNVRCLIRAFELFAADVPVARLDIVGDGPDRDALQRQVAAAGLGGRVVFHGEQQEVTEFLVNATVFVCTSFREGLSNAIMEAMSAGLPVVASNVGGNPELLAHERTGLLFPVDDHETLAHMLRELLGDDAKRRRLGAAARGEIRRFHEPRHMAAEMERIYARCLHEADACVVER